MYAGAFMAKRTQRKIEKVRASRDGHEFHEAWASRKALQLVMPNDGFVGIAVEGPVPTDQKNASSETVEIADLVLYYGKHPTFDEAHSVVIVQVKYSISSQHIPFRASDSKKTIQKFSAAYKNHKKNYNTKDVEKKLKFQLITNRPIYSNFTKAIEGLASETPLKGDEKQQAKQFTSACGLTGKELAQFARKVKITGLAGSLKQNSQQLSLVLADWSIAPDAMARARLGNMRQLLRDKAGSAGDQNNVITRTDVLDALELQSPEDLFPCPAGFPEIGKIVEREQLSTVLNRIPNIDKPFLIHADGGVGKTVFLQSLAKKLSETHKTVLFDCFGGGVYRAPEDARHLPKRGLIHIINNLACNSLCDPLLPTNENVEELVKAFRIRLAQAVKTLQIGSPGKQLLLFIDAIDNAAEHAKDKGELAFPRLLLESFHYSGPVAGVRLIVSCRTYRRDISRGDLPCEEFKLKPFTLVETERYLRQRIPVVTDTQIQIAYSRSEGNPRVLEHLALSDRGLLDPSEINNVIKLDDLLKKRIQEALSEAMKRGYKKSNINAFLAGLSVLPPPIPLEEYADAHGMEISAVRSFAADLAPLLEQTRYGIIFRDEPTESLIHEEYAAKRETLRILSKNLFKKQGTSVYAASALPGLLQKLDDGKLLFDLAFDERFPAAITSTVGKQNIRYARLKAAVLHAARKKNFDRLVHLLVELSTLAAVNQRGTDYILDNPDLVIASHDIDATRRLFETRTRWPGTRHARLIIASVLSGDLGSASRHAVSGDEWIHHFYRQKNEYRRYKGGPERIDIASLPFYMVAQNRGHDAAEFMKRWKNWYAYEVAEHIFTLLRQAEGMGDIPEANIHRFLSSLKSQPGVLAAALSFLELDIPMRQQLIKELAKACKKTKTIETNEDFHRQENYRVQDGLLKAVTIAVAMGMHPEASAIAESISYEKPRLWSFMDRFANRNSFPFIIYTALRSAVERQSITEHMLLPKELIDIGARVSKGTIGDAFRKELKAELEKGFKSQKELPDKKQSISYDTKRDAGRFIDELLEPLVEITQAFTTLLSSEEGNADKPFLELIDVWMKLRMKRNLYSDVHETNRFFDLLGLEFLIFSLWSHSDLNASSVNVFVTKITEDVIKSAQELIKIIAILSKRPNLHESAGKIAIKAKSLIEREDEVSFRASLFAGLSRAIMPASFEEATCYFRVGLEQMDTIGSGDYQFTNELLLFAAELRGDELEEPEFHTLSNICELNMPHEEEKFPWLAFARGLAKTSGCRTLAKLGRWDDRDKISLNYTLLPYLTALIEQDKIDPSIAVALLRVSDPAELYICGTEEFAKAIARKQYPNSKELLTELILQFERNNPNGGMPRTLATLHKIAESELGKDSEQSACLSLAAKKYKKLRDEGNENRNYHGVQEPRLSQRKDDKEKKNRLALKEIEDKTNPADETSMSLAIDVLNNLQHLFDLKKGFFEDLRKKITYAERPKYIQIISRLESLDIYTKLEELKECKRKWGISSVALDEVFHDSGVPLIQTHAYDFIHFDYLSGSQLKEISELSGISVPLLALELIIIFAAPDSHLPASVWMNLAAIICEKTSPGESQIALKRLLNSNSAQLASTVMDGAWNDGLYPKNEETEIAAGLVWLMLGSPSAAHRWRAAHSIRCFARLGKWKVIDVIIDRFHSTNAHPYQAPELPFYFLHARLWLLIAIARVAMDHSQDVATYADMLKAIALDENTPQILFRHFAAQALLTCACSKSIVMSEDETKALKLINKSPFPKKTTKEYRGDSFYQERLRPHSIPEPEAEFYLDYDFDKTDVTKISDIFDRSRWQTKDAITARVRTYDPGIKSMHDSGGHSGRHQDRIGMSDRYHLYGQQLGWHALYLVAGEFLAKYPVVQRPYDDDDPWNEWLKYQLLTRDDGLWLADGVDRPPLDAQVNLCEKDREGLVLTGDKAKLLALLKIESSIAEDLVVAGDWYSSDDIGIHISSALIPPQYSDQQALQLSQEDPFQAWLPQVESDNDGEYFHSSKKPFIPWVVWPSIEAKLDETDSLGVNSAIRRLYFTKSINAINTLKPLDPFRRKWVDPNSRVMVRSEAWGRNPSYDDEDSISGNRLICRSNFLKDVFEKQHAELLVLVILRKYEKAYGSEASKYWHTTAVIRVDHKLDFTFYSGAVNKRHVMKW